MTGEHVVRNVISDTLIKNIRIATQALNGKDLGGIATALVTRSRKIDKSESSNVRIAT